MKLIAFYATGLTLLCVMVFGGIEGFSFKFSVVTERYISETTEAECKQLIVENRSNSKQIKSNPATDHQGLKRRARVDSRISIVI